MQSFSPVMSEKTFASFGAEAEASKVMTVQGSVNKTFILLGLAALTATYTWGMFSVSMVGNVRTVTADPNAMLWIGGGAIAALVFCLITCFAPRWVAITAPLYALSEGLFLGGISGLLDARYPGIAIQAVMLTFGTLLALLLAYSSGLIKVTDRFRSGVTAAVGAVFLVYMASWILGMFGVGIPYIHGSGPIGIGFSVVVIIVASLSLVLDFDLIATGAKRGAPKYMEWYGAFAVMVTLVWLYIEFLKLLAKLRDR